MRHRAALHLPEGGAAGPSHGLHGPDLPAVSQGAHTGNLTTAWGSPFNSLLLTSP